MWCYEYIDDICLLQNNTKKKKKKRYTQTLTVSLKVSTIKRLEIFSFHLMSIKRVYASTLMST